MFNFIHISKLTTYIRWILCELYVHISLSMHNVPKRLILNVKKVYILVYYYCIGRDMFAHKPKKCLASFHNCLLSIHFTHFVGGNIYYGTCSVHLLVNFVVMYILHWCSCFLGCISTHISYYTRESVVICTAYL